MRSIGIDLEPCCRQDLLRFEAARPTLYGLETHLATIHRAVQEFDPRLVVLDPITNFVAAGTRSQVKGMLLRLIDYLKCRGITGIFISLTSGGAPLEQTATEV